MGKFRNRNVGSLWFARCSGGPECGLLSVSRLMKRLLLIVDRLGLSYEFVQTYIHFVVCLLLRRVMRQILVDKTYSMCQNSFMQRQRGHWHIYKERFWNLRTSYCTEMLSPRPL